MQDFAEVLFIGLGEALGLFPCEVCVVLVDHQVEKLLVFWKRMFLQECVSNVVLEFKSPARLFILVFEVRQIQIHLRSPRRDRYTPLNLRCAGYAVTGLIRVPRCVVACMEPQMQIAKNSFGR